MRDPGTAAPSTLALHPQQQRDAATDHVFRDAMSNGRKRPRDAANAYIGVTNGAATGWDQPQGPSPVPTPHIISPYSGDGAQYAGDAAAVGASSLNEGSGMWNPTKTASPYVPPQSYFYPSSGPDTYDQQYPASVAAYDSQTDPAYPVEQTGGSMPYFPPQQSGIESFSGYENATDQQYARDVDTTMPDQYVPPDEGQSNQPDQVHAFYFDDASMQLKVQSLSILENLATQLIHTIAKASFQQMQEALRGDDAGDGQAYSTLKSLFDQTRKVYSRETPFIDAIAIQMFQPNQQEVIRKANIATFVSSILGAHDVSFYHLNEFFMETFVPLGHRLLKWQGAIYLELKTQTYISALMNSDGNPQVMLDELFPADLDAQILTRHPDAPSLSPSEQDFIDRSRARKSYLSAENMSEDDIKDLSKKYQWQDFVREFASCINKNVDGIMNLAVKSQRDAANNAAAADGRPGSISHPTTGAASDVAIPATAANGSAAARSAQAKDNPDQAKKPSVQSSTVRQPWTTHEEEALLDGLARMNGPHWSQILALYGRGGSISEVLKDRNQVQLKDKARNLKLWYLKMGKELPVALRGVTGELRKRGGARARLALGVDESGGGEEEGKEGDAEAEGDEDSTQPPTKGKGSASAAKKKTKKGS